jgi:hypothetical protein
VTTHHIAVFGRPRQPCTYQQEENNSMRRATLTVVALLGLGVVPLTAVPALAEYGAIAWDEATGKRGASWHEPTAKRAAEAAIGECGASGCKVITSIGPRMCGALAASEDGKKVGAAARKDRDAARVAALKNCPKTSGECAIRLSDCNK